VLPNTYHLLPPDILQAARVPPPHAVAPPNSIQGLPLHEHTSLYSVDLLTGAVVAKVGSRL
jgi:hypothetical protein